MIPMALPQGKGVEKGVKAPPGLQRFWRPSGAFGVSGGQEAPVGHMVCRGQDGQRGLGRQ